MAPKLYLSAHSLPAATVLMTADVLGLELETKYIDMANGEHLTPEFLKVTDCICYKTDKN